MLARVKLIIGTDEDRAVVHAIAKRLEEKGHSARVLPVGPWGRVATEVARAVAGGDVDQGVVCCWTGTGVTIAANKVRGVRAALCHDTSSARLARQHNDANVLALGARLIGEEAALDTLQAFLSTGFDGGERHARRVGKLGQ